jgi:hypothetical protein
MFGYIAAYAAYYRHTLSLYLNEDSGGSSDSDNNSIPNTADEYLFNARDDEDMPRPLSPLPLLSPPLFSYC